MRKLAVDLFRYTTKYDTPFWKGTMLGMLFVAALGFFALSLGMPTGIGVWLDIPLFTTLGLGLVIVCAMLLAVILALLRIPIPRWFAGHVISIYFTFLFTLPQFNMNVVGSSFIAAVLVVLGFLVGSAVTMVVCSMGAEGFTYSYAGVALFAFIFVWAWLLLPGKEVYKSVIPPQLVSKPPLMLNVEDPSKPGKYQVVAFTYGSGGDLPLDEFAGGVDFVTETVDASSFLEEFHILRNLFWGFDEQSLPLNGRVWMPEGEGPFPLVIIVHGNHKMEHFSYTGYDYLGEHLASRGFMAVSISEDFINFSIWSEGLDNDMTIRAWVLLQHLIMLEQASYTKETPFYKKIDMDKVAVVGHSRGGQAAVLAAEFAEFYNKSNYPEISLDVNFSIQAIAAIAPVDWLVEDRYIELEDVDYLTIQGSHDSDVNTFYGNRQYQRTTFDQHTAGFKATLYVEGANHGQFNTSWDYRDTTMPTALLLNRGEMINREEQQHIAKLYITAFLEASLHGQQEYLPILQDYRTALDWLPQTTYINQFQDASFFLLNGREKDKQLEEASEQELQSRTDHSMRIRAVYLAWDGKKEGRYMIQLPTSFAEEAGLDQETVFHFSLANADLDRTRPYRRLPQMELELIMVDGTEAVVPLTWFGSYPPVIHTHFTKHPIFEKSIKNGRLGESAEPVFQSYALPFSDVMALYETFEPSRLQQINFVFKPGAPGELWLDELGFSRNWNAR